MNNTTQTDIKVIQVVQRVFRTILFPSKEGELDYLREVELLGSRYLEERSPRVGKKEVGR